MAKFLVALGVLLMVPACSGSTDGDGGRGGASSGSGGIGGSAGAAGASGAGGISGAGAVGGASGAGAAGGAGGAGGGTDCGSATITPVVDRKPGNLLIVFDRSTSMEQEFAPGVTRLKAAQDAVVNGLTPFTCPPGATNPDGPGCKETLTVGSIFFPSDASVAFVGPCPVHEITAPTQINWMGTSPFLAAFQNFWMTQGMLFAGTPLVDAFAKANTALTTSMLTGTTAVLFLTDGGETCLGDIATPPMQAASWLGTGIKTYVVNVGATNDPLANAQLNEDIASSGGTAPAINPTDTGMLTAAITEILMQTSSVTSCEIALTGARLSNLDMACARGEVFAGPTKLMCDPVNGFQVTAADKIELFGNACASLMASGVLNATFPCDLILE